jgi:hypothetical protein
MTAPCGDPGHSLPRPPITAPSGRYAYVDKVRIWIEKPLSETEVASLARHGLTRAERGPSPFSTGFRQLLHLSRPSPQALMLIARKGGEHRINYIELAQDLVFRTWPDIKEARSYFDRHLIKKHHREQGIRFVAGQTRYTARRGAPSNLVVYSDLPCRLTQEENCLHVEMRFTGVRSVRRAGISNIAELRRFDHRRFWQERLLLVELDYARLGRMLRNRRNGARRRSSRSTQDDYQVGLLTEQACGSIQQIIDTYRQIRVRDCLIPLDVSDLLPPVLAS